MLSALVAAMFIAPLYCEAFCPSQEELDRMEKLLKENNKMLKAIIAHFGVPLDAGEMMSVDGDTDA